MRINRKSQISRVIAAQGLSASEASEQVDGRIYEARLYLKRRAALRSIYCDAPQQAFWMWNGVKYYNDHPDA